MNYTFNIIAHRNLVANFTINSYSIEASVLPANSGTITGTGNYNYGANVSLTATPETGYTFNDWTENGIQVSTDATYIFIASTNRTLVANFTINSYSIEASVLPANSGTITGTGNYNYGANISLTATPETGYTFKDWTENGIQISTDATYPFTSIVNRSLVANFQSTVGIDNLENLNINIYPNPAKTILFITGLPKNVFVTVFDFSGKMLINKPIKDKQIDISNLANGFYTIKISDKNEIVTKNFIKQ